MLRLLVAVVAISIVLIGEALLVMFVAAGAIWWVLFLFAALSLLVLVRLVVGALKPSGIVLVFGLVVTVVALVSTYSVVGAILGEGWVEVVTIHSDMRRRIERTRAIQLFDVDGRPVGILPAALDPDRAGAPYLAVPVRPADVPTVFWACTKFLEDRDLDEPWVVFGMNFRRLGGAVLSKAIGKRDGASGLAEMVVRSIENAPPNPRQNLWYELPRKFMSWRELPALSQVFPTEEELKAAVATHLTLMTPAPGSHFGGGEIHGVVLAASVLGKLPEELTAAEQALLAASLQQPLRIGEGATWAKQRSRADYCLANAPLGDGFDRERVRKELANIAPPQRPLRHPAADAGDRLGGHAAALVRQLSSIGPDWPQRVASVRLAVRQPLAGLAERMREAAQEVERQYAGRLTVPLWSGEDAAFVYGAVATPNGEIVATISNTDFDLAGAKLPIGSVGKVAAAIALSDSDTPNAAIQSAFARSYGPTILHRLHRIPAEKVTRAFAALGWNLQPGQSPKRIAINGAVEVEPEAVLRALIALNDLITADRFKPAAIVGLIHEAEFVDGQRIAPTLRELPVDQLREILTPRARNYMATVLGAPLKNGTMRFVGAALRKQGATHIWGKSGTADTTSGGFGTSPTRALWNVGGFAIAGRRLSFVMLVASRNSAKPLGFVQSPTIAPMTVALISHAINQVTDRKIVARFP